MTYEFSRFDEEKIKVFLKRDISEVTRLKVIQCWEHDEENFRLLVNDQKIEFETFNKLLLQFCNNNGIIVVGEI